MRPWHDFPTIGMPGEPEASASAGYVPCAGPDRVRKTGVSETRRVRAPRIPACLELCRF